MVPHVKLQNLVKQSGMTKPGLARMLGINRDKLDRMYYGRDHVLPGLIEAMQALLVAQKNVRILFDSYDAARRYGEDPERF